MRSAVLRQGSRVLANDQNMPSLRVGEVRRSKFRAHRRRYSMSAVAIFHQPTPVLTLRGVRYRQPDLAHGTGRGSLNKMPVGDQLARDERYVRNLRKKR